MKKLCDTQIGAAIALLALVVNLPAQAKTLRHQPTASSAQSAYIFNSGSAGLPGYRITVSSTGRIASVTLLRNGRTSGGRHGILTPAVTQRFFSDLAQAGPVGALPTNPNASSGGPDIAPNIRISIRYGGQQSPNLRRAGSEAGARLLQDAKQIIQVLRLPVPDTP